MLADLLFRLFLPVESLSTVVAALASIATSSSLLGSCKQFGSFSLSDESQQCSTLWTVTSLGSRLCTSLNLTAIPDGRMTTSSGKDTIFRLALWFAISIGTGSFGGRTVPVFSSTISDNGGGGGGMRPLKIFLARYGMAAYDDSS